MIFVGINPALLFFNELHITAWGKRKLQLMKK